MPFNGSGTFTIINTFIPSTTILSASVNANYSDIATGLSDCLTRDGQAGMTASLGIVSGTVNAPGLHFNSEGGSGFYLSSTGVPAIAIASAHAITFAAQSTANGFGIGSGTSILLPMGTIWDYAGSAAPTGWLFCFGQEVSGAVYPELFAAIGTNWGTASTATAFIIPDLRGRALYGKDDMGGTPANRITAAASSVTGTQLGAVGGAQSSTALIAHTHTATDSGHTHTYQTPQSNVSVASGAVTVTSNEQAATTGTGTANITVATAGSGSSFALLNPAAIVNKIIFAGH